MKKILLAFAVVALATSPALAGSKNKNNNVSQSWSQSQASSRSSINQQDRAQAPGFGVGGGYCSDAVSASFPGGGFGFSTMSRVCKQEKLLGMADTYYGRPAARQVGCENVKEFRSLPACVNGRNQRAAAIQRRDRARYGN